MPCPTKRECTLCGLIYPVYFNVVAVINNRSCNPDGVSPPMLKDVSRFTGPLLTVRAAAYCSHCGMTSSKSMRHSRRSPRRVEWPSTKCSSNSVQNHCRHLCQKRLHSFQKSGQGSFRKNFYQRVQNTLQKRRFSELLLFNYPFNNFFEQNISVNIGCACV